MIIIIIIIIIVITMIYNISNRMYEIIMGGMHSIERVN